MKELFRMAVDVKAKRTEFFVLEPSASSILFLISAVGDETAPTYTFYKRDGSVLAENVVFPNFEAVAPVQSLVDAEWGADMFMRAFLAADQLLPVAGMIAGTGNEKFSINFTVAETPEEFEAYAGEIQSEPFESIKEKRILN
jgi:hypothetical protein